MTWKQKAGLQCWKTPTHYASGLPLRRKLNQTAAILQGGGRRSRAGAYTWFAPGLAEELKKLARNPASRCIARRMDQVVGAVDRQRPGAPSRTVGWCQFHGAMKGRVLFLSRCAVF